MMAMIDDVTGMVYWVPAEYQAPVHPPFSPVVMPYRFLRPVAPVMAPAQPPLGPVVNTTVFVRGVPRESTTQTVEAHFKIYGEIVTCHVIRHKDASTNKGIAFVKFHDHVSAQRAIDCNNPGIMEQREIFAEWAHPKPDTSASRPLPDQPIATEYMPRPNTPHLYVAPPATHLINSPSFFPVPGPVMPAITFNAHLPWQLRASSSMAAYGSYGGHVLGFPHPGLSGDAYGQEIGLAVPSPIYNSVMDYNYNPGGGTASVSGIPFGHPSEDVQKDGENSDEHTTPRRSFVAEESSTSEGRKGKEKSNNS